jgi:hypothetical protein
MTDHVARMVNRWLSRAQEDSQDPELAAQLVDAIHRMIREAEDEMRCRCEEIAQRVAGPDIGGQVALAIRLTTKTESLPRKSLLDAFAESTGH